MNTKQYHPVSLFLPQLILKDYTDNRHDGNIKTNVTAQVLEIFHRDIYILSHLIYSSQRLCNFSVMTEQILKASRHEFSLLILLPQNHMLQLFTAKTGLAKGVTSLSTQTEKNKPENCFGEER